jgi:hypothetical protein
LTNDEFKLHYPSVGFHGQVGPWTGRIEGGVFRVTGSSEARAHPMINTFNYTIDIDGHQEDLRDCIFSVAVKIESPFLPNNGAGLIIRYVKATNDSTARGIVFLKEPNRCCSIFYMQGGVLTRKASYPLSSSEVHNQDPFDTLKVRASGNRVTFMVNGKTIAEKDDKVLKGFSSVAIIAMGQGSFQFDNLELWLLVFFRNPFSFVMIIKPDSEHHLGRSAMRVCERYDLRNSVPDYSSSSLRLSFSLVLTLLFWRRNSGRQLM